jgi:hypothetical protein
MRAPYLVLGGGQWLSRRDGITLMPVDGQGVIIKYGVPIRAVENHGDLDAAHAVIARAMQRDRAERQSNLSKWGKGETG